MTVTGAVKWQQLWRQQGLERTTRRGQEKVTRLRGADAITRGYVSFEFLTIFYINVYLQLRPHLSTQPPQQRLGTGLETHLVSSPWYVSVYILLTFISSNIQAQDDLENDHDGFKKPWLPQKHKPMKLVEISTSLYGSPHRSQRPRVDNSWILVTPLFPLSVY